MTFELVKRLRLHAAKRMDVVEPLPHVTPANSSISLEVVFRPLATGTLDQYTRLLLEDAIWRVLQLSISGWRSNDVSTSS